MKKLLCAVLSGIMAFSTFAVAVPITASAAESQESVSATYGDFEYTLENDYTCTITGYNGTASNITIPSTIYGNKVCKIGYQSFRFDEDIVNVKIPYGVTEIDTEAFELCEKLKSVTLPNSLSVIGFESFRGCKNLENISIPSSVNKVDSYAFEGCEGLVSVTFKEGVKIIGSGAFRGCEKLNSLVFPNSLQTIGSLTFSGCVNLKNISFGSNLKEIDCDVFEYFNGWDYCKKLEKITVNNNNNYYCAVDGVMFDKKKTEIIFYPYAKSNTSFVVPSSINTLYSETIVNNPYLKTITIPASVTDIRDHAVGYIEDGWDYNKVSGFTIKGYKGTAAERYARNNDFNFVQLQVVPTSVSLNKTSLTLDVGKSYTLTKTVSPSNAVTSYTWSSSNTSVATVDSNGKVTAKKAGTATITVKTSNGKTANCKVTVNLPTPQITSLANTTGGIKISWNKVDGAYGYRLYYKPASGGWKRFKDTTATSFTDSGVSPNRTETYTIRCIDKNGNTVSGFNSNCWSKKYTPAAPTISKLENTSGGIKISWNKIAGAYGYRLYYKTSSGGWKRFKDTTATSFTDSGVSPNRTETYTIRCIDKNGNTVSGFYSRGWSKKYTPVAPTITRLSNTSKGVSVTWNKIAGVYGYRLYRKYDGGSWTRVKDTTSTSFTDSGAKKGKKVTYTVRCIDRKGKTVSGFNSKGWSITRK